MQSDTKGPISWMARNGVAANLLMLLIIVGGVLGYSTVVQEVFPETNLDQIQVRVEYLGASPDEVEESIVRRVEEQIESVEGIDRITSVAAENVGVITAELELGVDASRALDDIKAEIDRITTFPVEAEEPEVKELTSRRRVIQLAIHGDGADERTLKELANSVKDELTVQGIAAYVEVDATRPYEISIEVAEATLRAYGVSIEDVARAVRSGSLDLPGGTLKTEKQEILIRTKGQNYTGRDFAEIIVLARDDGTTVRLGQIATITDGFEDNDLVARFDGTAAALVTVYRTSDERVFDIVEATKEYLVTLQAQLPAGVEVDVWQDDAKLLESRFDLLVKNGRLGLILVLLLLALFMDIRLAFWTAVGLFVSFVGVFAVMDLLGVSVNMISLFAFILAIGIVVDDAIVIGENIYAEQEKGEKPLRAAIKGAKRLAVPVTFSVLTTVAAFSPLLFTPGSIGKLLATLPVIVIAVLLFSLLETIFILPAHLSHVHFMAAERAGVIVRFFGRLQGFVAKYATRFVEGPLTKIVGFCVRHYGIVQVSAIALIFLTVGAIGGGLIKFSFFPPIEGNNVIASIEMPPGTPASQTLRVIKFVEEKGFEAIDELQSQLPDEHPDVVNHLLSTTGVQPSRSNSPDGGDQTGLIQPSIGEINIELIDAEFRDVSSAALEDLWREKVGQVPGVKRLTFRSALFSLGKPIQAEVSAPTAELIDIGVERMKAELESFAGVIEVEDDQEQGKREIQLALSPQGRTLGVSVDDLARQVRAGFYGAEALRVQRGRDEVKVMVRLPKSERDALTDLGNMRIRTPAGAQIPLSEVASASYGFGPSSIQRRDRRRVVTVRADVNEEVISAQEVVTALNAGIVPRLEADYPGLKVSFEGEQREQSETVGALARGFMIALFVIYALLAIPFKSYIQPFIVMCAIPFGVIGALLAHMLLGLSVGIISLFGIVGLSGVVVNDSLVLIDFINERRRSGVPMAQAIVEGAQARFRPILLTSLTTFVGVLPLILERSLQAQFLVPMAASLGFGILFATFVLLLLVPAITMMVYDWEVWFKSKLQVLSPRLRRNPGL